MLCYFYYNLPCVIAGDGLRRLFSRPRTPLPCTSLGSNKVDMTGLLCDKVSCLSVQTDGVRASITFVLSCLHLYVLYNGSL